MIHINSSAPNLKSCLSKKKSEVNHLSHITVSNMQGRKFDIS